MLMLQAAPLLLLLGNDVYWLYFPICVDAIGLPDAGSSGYLRVVRISCCAPDSRNSSNAIQSMASAFRLAIRFA